MAEEKPGGIQPFEITQAKKAEFLLELVETGSIRGAAARVGIAFKTVYRHAEKDEDFREAIDNARGEFEQATLRAIARAGVEGEVIERRGKKITKPGDWRALTWLLEHSPAYRESYAGVLRQRVEIGGSEDMPPIQTEQMEQVEIGPGTMDRLSSVIMVLVQNGILRLPDPNEVIDVTPDEANGH